MSTKKPRRNKPVKENSLVKKKPSYMEDPTVEDVLKLNQAVDIVLMEPHLLSKPLYLWSIFIQAKVRKTVADYRSQVKELPDDVNYNKELSKLPLNAEPSDVESKMKEKFPEYFEAMRKLWETPLPELKIEKAKSSWLEHCQNATGVVSLAKIGAFDDLESLRDILYE
jgi:hypothetical protein